MFFSFGFDLHRRVRDEATRIKHLSVYVIISIVYSTRGLRKLRGEANSVHAPTVAFSEAEKRFLHYTQSSIALDPSRDETRLNLLVAAVPKRFGFPNFEGPSSSPLARRGGPARHVNTQSHPATLSRRRTRTNRGPNAEGARREPRSARCRARNRPTPETRTKTSPHLSTSSPS